MTAWYNEPDPIAAQWLRNLIEAGEIAPGVVDTRDIREVEAYEIASYTQVHLFAGVGVWSLALRNAGWSDNEPVWTGSCPCPPFSQAGRGQTCPACGSRRNICHPRKTGHFVCLACGCDRHADDRHLWPEASRLIRDGKPSVFVGEQVASADGRIWLGAVSADLQTMDYAVAGSDICAAGFGGAHIRQRNYFFGLADPNLEQREWGGDVGSGGRREFANIGTACGMGDAMRGRAGSVAGNGDRPESPVVGGNGNSPGTGIAARDVGATGGLAHADDTGSQGRRVRRDRSDERAARPRSLVDGLVDSNDDGREPWERDYQAARQGASFAAASRFGFGHNGAPADAPMLGRNAADWLYCRDGKWRPVEPFTFPLVDEAPARVGRLRAYGNALDLETATQFCGAVKEIVDDVRSLKGFDL